MSVSACELEGTPILASRNTVRWESKSPARRDTFEGGTCVSVSDGDVALFQTRPTLSAVGGMA